MISTLQSILEVLIFRLVGRTLHLHFLKLWKNTKPALNDSLEFLGLFSMSVMFQERVKSAKIIELKRRFSSCSNLGRQIDRNEIINEVDGLRSSKAPHFISSLYHSIQQNLPIVQNLKLVHSSSVDNPYNFNSKRLRSGSCPHVLTSNTLVNESSLCINNNIIFDSINPKSNAPNLCGAKCMVNSQNSSFPYFEKFHSTIFNSESGGRVIKVNKSIKHKCETHNTSVDLTDSNLAIDKIENIYSDAYSSYEDLNEESLMKYNHSPKCLLNNNFSSLSSLKRTVSTECFNLTRNGSITKWETNSFPCQTGLRKYERDSFFSNSDIYNLKSPVEGRTLLYKLPSGVTKDNKTTKVDQDFKEFFSNNQPILVKTVSDQQLSSLQIHHIEKLNGSKDMPLQSCAFDTKLFNLPNKSSVYVSSVFLNLTNAQSGKHESKNYSISSRGIKSDTFSQRPSTLCLNQVSSSQTRMPSSVIPYSRRKFQSGAVINVQKKNFSMLLRSIKEAVQQKDLLKSDIDQMEHSLFHNREFLGCLKPFCIQELKRSNFVLKSEIIKLTRHLEVNYEGNNEEDGEDYLYESQNNQRWSYNPSYDGKH